MNTAVGIPAPGELNWQGVRFRDPVGRVFESDGQFYRAIYPEAVEYVETLFERGVIDQLVDLGLLVDTCRSELQVDGYGMVLHHGRVPFKSRISMWPRPLIRDAARLIVDLNLALREWGLTTIDFHVTNVQQIGGSRPVWIDLGSIQPLRPESSPDHRLLLPGARRAWRWARSSAAAGTLERDVRDRFFLIRKGIASIPVEFRSQLLYPLALLAKNADWGRVVRALAGHEGITDSDFRLLGPRTRLPRVSRDAASWLEPVGAWLDDLEFPSLKTYWGSYSTANSFVGPSVSASNPRKAAVERIVRESHPQRVVDLGCNTGAFSAIVSEAAPGCDIFAVDADEGAVESLYRNVRDAEGLSVTTAFADVLRLSKDASRPQGDLAIALALSHHLFFSQSCSFPVIAKLLAAFTTGALLTDFMPNGLGVSRLHPRPLPPTYSLERFKRSLQEHFENVEIVDSIVDPNSPRILLWARDKR